MTIPQFTADSAVAGAGRRYAGRLKTGDAAPESVMPQTAPGFYYGGQHCHDHVLYDSWTEINGGPPVYHDWPIGSC